MVAAFLGSRYLRDEEVITAQGGQDHAGVAASTIADGVGYFADW